MSKYIQDANATLTWLHDWSKRFARAEKDLGLDAGTLTLSSPTVTGPDGVTVSDVLANVAGTGVSFKLATTLDPAVDIILTTTVTLSNGDTDEDEFTIGIV